jgi:hypothetical protein
MQGDHHVLPNKIAQQHQVSLVPQAEQAGSAGRRSPRSGCSERRKSPGGAIAPGTETEQAVVVFQFSLSEIVPIPIVPRGDRRFFD